MSHRNVTVKAGSASGTPKPVDVCDEGVSKTLVLRAPTTSETVTLHAEPAGTFSMKCGRTSEQIDDDEHVQYVTYTLPAEFLVEHRAEASIFVWQNA